MVGGGISGLAAAWALTRAPDPPEVRVLEASPRVGGKLLAHEVAGLRLDAGAESFLARRPEAVELAREVGLGDDLVAPATASAAVWSRGGLHPLPAGQVMGVPADLRALAASGLLTGRELARVPLDAWLPRTHVGSDVSVGAYVRSRLGSAVVDRLVDPLLGGVYAGSADRLSLAATVPALFARAREERSLLAAAQAVRSAAAVASGPPFLGVRGGVARLAAALADRLGDRVRTSATVRELRRTPTGWSLLVGPTAAPQVVEADAVVLALPARPAARLLMPLTPYAAAELGHVEYASVALVTFVLPAPAALPPGSGFLVPAVEGRHVKAATFASAKWGWVGESGATVVRASAGRHGDERELQLDDAALAQRLWSDLGDLVPLPRRPFDARVTRWGGGLPQYAVGHLGRVARVRAALVSQPTLALAGAAYDGVGIPACIASGRAAAAQVLEALLP